MSEGLFASAELGGGVRAGYRLHHLEVFNWGTFDKRVWRLTPGGETALLTGDIGSGKSTLVDAVTTLLLPAHRISYNKAAGAEARERTLRSYVEGHYKSERNEATGTSRAIGLRDHTSYSVVLGVFVNEGYDETVTLAQVFHQKDRAGQPDRFFVTAGKALSVEADFTAFGSDLADLRRRLRAGGAEIHNVFPDYSRQVRRLLGIRSEQAMELFHQTVSMKSVGNLNEFVRSHMLEPADASERIRGIVAHFEDLTKAHEAVRRARDQLDALAPLVATVDRYDDAVVRRAAAERERDAVRLFVAELRIDLLTTEIAADTARRDQRETAMAVAEQRRRELTAERERLIADRAAAGGDRVAQLERDEQSARDEADARRSRRDDFDARLTAAGLPPVHAADGFGALGDVLRVASSELTAERSDLDESLVDMSSRRQDLGRRGEETRLELASLASRTNNLPTAQLALRERLCDDLGLDPDDLPFAGELLDVADEHSSWRGAAERVLRGFALSLLVPDQHYPRVSQWVNERRLEQRRADGRTAGMRLVYERVPARRVRLQPAAVPGNLALADCIVVKDGEFADYLRDELTKRADHRCTESLEAFRRETRAVTREGQVRSRDRHEKDDRGRVDDPRSWVLGWANEQKVAALHAQLADLQSALLTVDDDLARVRERRDAATVRGEGLAALGAYGSWSDLDHESSTARAEAAAAERQRLLSGSSTLAEIERRLQSNSDDLARADDELGRANGDIRVLDDRVQRTERERADDEALITAYDPDDLATARATYEALTGRAGDTLPTASRECGALADQLTSGLQRSIDQLGKEIGGYVTSAVSEMHKVLARWPELRAEMDADIDARDDFRALHARVAGDDLPRFEADFKEQLNTNTIRELAAFSSWLNRQADEIQIRIDRINDAMGAIDYEPGRYIRLEKERTVNHEVQAFRKELREATTDALAADGDAYSEQRFIDVQRILERFRGRDSHAESDRAWTRRVTDVRNWFTFSASERERETDEEWQHYRDSDGKSGGQKEKLAYTILAASLAYQFGLEWGASRSKDFRFAVIDEAFGRGSDASTRYALDLFAKLGLQLLIVTPLQKVHVIEPYVRAIGFVDNPSGNYSRLQTLTIEEFHARREGAGESRAT
jgi:uncharacterized protein YPO0396